MRLPRRSRSSTRSSASGSWASSRRSPPRPDARERRLMASYPRLAALLGAACLAFSGIFFRYSGASPSTATLFRCLYALPFLVVLGVLEDRRFGRRERRDRLI